jgi:hypothetical protein
MTKLTREGLVMNLIQWIRAGVFVWLLCLAAATAQAICPAGYPRSTPDSDFADAGDGTVRHIPTGLIWKRCAEGQTWDGSTCTGAAAGYTWEQVFTRAASVNNGDAGTQNAGQSDWRAPNLNELKSIVEPGCYSPSINPTQFPATPASGFWSASPFAGFSDYAWRVYFDYGLDGGDVRSNALQVRLVRAGPYFYNFDAAAAAPVISPGTPPGGTVGTAYNFTVIASGSPTFSATGLPPGLDIDPASGVISGTPTTPGSFNASIIATNAGGPASANYTIVIAAAAVVTTATAVPTLSEWGAIALSLLMASAAVLGLRRRK